MTDSEMSFNPPGEAIWAMIIMVTLILVILVFFCCMPFYQALEKRWRHWDDPENDPRWNAEHFQFSPTSPRLGRRDDAKNKYNRLSNASTIGGSSSSMGVSRGSSFRNQCKFPRDPEQVEIQMPPSYTDIFNQGSGDMSSLGTPPAYYSTSQSEEEITKDAAQTTQTKTKDVPSMEITKTKDVPSMEITVTKDVPSMDITVTPATPSDTPTNPLPVKKTYKKLKKKPEPKVDQ